MKKLNMAIAGFVLIVSAGSIVFAHDGHDDAPGSIKANHGGIVKAGININLEYVVAGNEVALYPLSHDGKDLSGAQVKLSATGKIPKGKTENLKIDTQNGFKTAVDFKGAYRSEVVVTADSEGKKDTFKFQVEKQ